MQELLNKINPNLYKLESFINNNAALELSNLSTPCYYPKTKRFYFEVLKILNITDKDVKAYVKRTYKGTKAEKWVLWQDVGTNILLFIMHLFLKHNKQKAFLSTVTYYMIIQYSRLMHKQIKYCYEETFKYTLDNLTRIHLFHREKTIANAILYLGNEIQNRYKKNIKDWDLEKIILLISVARHRISQSIKSFAEHYYKNRKEGLGFKTQIEDPEDAEKANMYQFQIQQRGQKIVDDIVKKFTIYRMIDKKAIIEAQKYSKAKTSIALLISNKLTDPAYQEDVKIALQLFIKDLKKMDMICGNKYPAYMKSLMGIKRISNKLQFKTQINILLKKLIKDTELEKPYEKYTNQTKYVINLYLAYYLSGVMKNILCK